MEKNEIELRKMRVESTENHKRISAMSPNQDVTRNFQTLSDRWTTAKVLEFSRNLYREDYIDAEAFVLENTTENEDDVFGKMKTIFQVALKQTAESVELHKEATLKNMSRISEQDPFHPERSVVLSSYIHGEVLVHLRESIFQNQLDLIRQKMIGELGFWRSLYNDPALARFVNGSIQLAWLMNARGEKMYAHFDDEKYCSQKHHRRVGKGPNIVSMIWPPIYMSEKAYKRNDQDVSEKGWVKTD